MVYYLVGQWGEKKEGGIVGQDNRGQTLQSIQPDSIDPRIRQQKQALDKRDRGMKVEVDMYS